MSSVDRSDEAPIPVVVVGAGPAGVTAATLLGQYGVRCLVLDRWDGVYPQPRAVHLDDEVYRILARVGVAEQFAAISRPALGLQLVDRDHRVFAVLDREGTTAATATPGRTCSTSRSSSSCCASTARVSRPSRCGATSR